MTRRDLPLSAPGVLPALPEPRVGWGGGGGLLKVVVFSLGRAVAAAALSESLSDGGHRAILLPVITVLPVVPETFLAPSTWEAS